jgi:hypothetical protein
MRRFAPYIRALSGINGTSSVDFVVAGGRGGEGLRAESILMPTMRPIMGENCKLNMSVDREFPSFFIFLFLFSSKWY